MPTLLDIKNFVADATGAGNGSTAVPKRDRIINEARRKYYSERRWSYLYKEATLTFSSYLADLPSDYNKKFDPIVIFTYPSTGDKRHFYKVPYDDVDLYPEDYVYGINKSTGKIKISRTDSELTIGYTHLPADKAIDTSDNTDTEEAPDITAIGYWATAMWWLSSERATGKYQLFKDEYEKQLAIDKQIDGNSVAIRPINPVNSRINSFYQGRRR